MMDEEEKKKIRAEIEVKRKELDELKAKLNELNVQKEAAFEKKRQATREISNLARTLKESKGKRDSFTKQVRDSKQRRSELNTLLKQKLSEMKKLQQEKRDISNKFSIRGDPSRIQKEIEELELKVETEALPFKIEQQIMKRIAERKKVLEQTKEVSDIFERVHALQKDIDRLRLKADDTHRKVQTKADASQQFHEELVESSKEMKDLRQKEEEALKTFVEWKQKWNDQNDIVRVKMDEIRELRMKIDDIDIEERKKTKKAEAKKLEEEEKSVEEKIKKGLKLTTEDLLVFQASEGMGKRRSRPKPKKEEPKKEKPKEEAKPEEPKQEASDKSE